jgi:hypothetical protein
MKWHAFNLAVAIVFISWLSKAVWHEVGLPPLLAGEQTAKIDTISNVPICPCKVSVTDIDSIEHSVQVNASSVFEAVALGLAALKKNSWAGEIPEGLNQIKVSQLNPAIEHVVPFRTFKDWIAQSGSTPAEKTARARVREILK